MVVFGVAPYFTREVAVIGSSRFVGFRDYGFGFVLRYAFSFRHSFYSVVKGSVNEHVKYVFVVCENVIRASADYYAGFSVGELFYNFGLLDVELYGNRLFVHIECARSPKELRFTLFVFGDKVGGESAVFGGFQKKFFVVTFYVQRFCEFFSDVSSAASVFSTYGNYGFFIVTVLL